MATSSSPRCWRGAPPGCWSIGRSRAPWDRVVVQVADTTRGLQDIARDVRRRSGAKVVAVTGSAGKTTTKEVTAEFLASRYRRIQEPGQPQ